MRQIALVWRAMRSLPFCPRCGHTPPHSDFTFCGMWHEAGEAGPARHGLTASCHGVPACSRQPAVPSFDGRRFVFFSRHAWRAAGACDGAGCPRGRSVAHQCGGQDLAPGEKNCSVGEATSVAQAPAKSVPATSEPQAKATPAKAEPPQAKGKASATARIASSTIRRLPSRSRPKSLMRRLPRRRRQRQGTARPRRVATAPSAARRTPRTRIRRRKSLPLPCLTASAAT